MKITYSVYYPSGNATALIEGMFPDEAKKKINDCILAKDKAIEQVGFITQDEQGVVLDMAGGEFCGNAVRSALFHYLKSGQDSWIRVSGAPYPLYGGVSGERAWAEMPLIRGDVKDSFSKIDDEHILVEMHGITHLLVYEDVFKPHMVHEDYKAKLIQHAMYLCTLYQMHDSIALGIMFVQKEDRDYRLYPVVRVPAAGTLFLESACGSGTVALGMYEAFLSGKSKSAAVFQPSGQSISFDVSFENGVFRYAKIAGGVTKMHTDVIDVELD